VLVGLEYERLIKEIGGYWGGYRVFPGKTFEDDVLMRVDPASLRSCRVFKTCVTVVGWMEELGFHIGHDDKSWCMFMEFVFKQFQPDVPMLGQIKNRLFYKMWKSSPILNDDTPRNSSEKLNRIYARLLVG